MADHPALDRRVYGTDTASIDTNTITVASCEANRTIVGEDGLKSISTVNRAQEA